MTHSTVVENFGIEGDRRYLEGYVTISSYTTNGEDLSDICNQFAQFDGILFQVAGSTGYLLLWDRTSHKLKVFTATATQASSAANVGVINFRASGR